jgi:hypothetical protein
MNTYKLRPLQAKQIYVSGSDETLHDLITIGRRSPGFINQHTVSAIFGPINDTNLILICWAFGGFNSTERSTIKILNVELGTLEPAWDIVTSGTTA